jgi:hypothetical protein
MIKKHGKVREGQFAANFREQHVTSLPASAQSGGGTRDHRP